MATAAGAAIARARRNIRHHFFSQDAVRPDRAVRFDPSWRLERRQFERMRARGIIHEAKRGHYWIDVVAYDADLTSRHHRVKIALAIALLALGVAVLIPLLRG